MISGPASRPTRWPSASRRNWKTRHVAERSTGPRLQRAVVSTVELRWPRVQSTYQVPTGSSVVRASHARRASAASNPSSTWPPDALVTNGRTPPFSSAATTAPTSWCWSSCADTAAPVAVDHRRHPCRATFCTGPKRRPTTGSTADTGRAATSARRTRTPSIARRRLSAGRRPSERMRRAAERAARSVWAITDLVATSADTTGHHAC